MTEQNADIRPATPLAPAMHAVEQAEVLDPLVDAGDTLSSAIVTNPAVKAALQGAWLGHALHPLLVEVPMGTWMSATALDVLGGEDARDSATLLTGLGIVTAVPATLTGWAEYAEADPRDRRVGVVHAGANAAGMALQLASFVARRAGRHGLGAVLGAGAMGVVGVGGYLGGHLSAARKVGTHDPTFGPHNPQTTG